MYFCGILAAYRLLQVDSAGQKEDPWIEEGRLYLTGRVGPPPIRGRYESVVLQFNDYSGLKPTFSIGRVKGEVTRKERRQVFQGLRLCAPVVPISSARFGGASPPALRPRAILSHLS